MHSFAKRVFRATRMRMPRWQKLNFCKLKDLSFLLPYSYDMLNSKIGRMLLSRFFVAHWLCLLTEYQLLWAILLYERFEFNNIKWLLELLRGIVFSPWTMIRLQFLATLSALYGMLMWKIHERRPFCHVRRVKSLWGQLPIRLPVLAVLISFGYCSAWIYLMYINELSPDLDLSFTGHYLLMNGAFCGFVHFLTDHLCLYGEVWPMPMLNTDDVILQWHRWQHIRFITSTKRAILNCIIYAFINWPNMSGDVVASFQLLWLSIWLTLLITIKLNTVKTIFTDVMHYKMPLTLASRKPNRVPNQTKKPHDQRLPIYLLLRINDHLFGLQLQTARKFYLLVSQNSAECHELYQLDGFFGKNPTNWAVIRDEILKNIDHSSKLMMRFINKVEKENGALKGKRKFAGIRCLGKDKSIDEIWIQNSDTQNPRVPRFGMVKEFLLSLMIVVNELKQRYMITLSDWFNVDSPIFSKADEMAFEICQCRKLLWLIPGLVGVCERSLEEDHHGAISPDLESIFQALIQLESSISDVHAEILAQKQKPCVTLALMLQVTTCCLNRMRVSFDRYLGFIISDQQLLQKLKNRSDSTYWTNSEDLQELFDLFKC